MLQYFKNKKIMVVVAHPDDELLGLGATMHKLIHDYNVPHAFVHYNHA